MHLSLFLFLTLHHSSLLLIVVSLLTLLIHVPINYFWAFSSSVLILFCCGKWCHTQSPHNNPLNCCPVFFDVCIFIWTVSVPADWLLTSSAYTWNSATFLFGVFFFLGLPMRPLYFLLFSSGVMAVRLCLNFIHLGDTRRASSRLWSRHLAACECEFFFFVFVSSTFDKYPRIAALNWKEKKTRIFFFVVSSMCIFLWYRHLSLESMFTAE